jgi:hypothetical protein
MVDRIKPILFTTVAVFVVTYSGVRFLFAPQMGPDYASSAPFSPELTSLLGSLVFVLFFDYAIGMVGDVMKTAMVIALSQIMIVDVYYVINGERGVVPAVMSAGVLLASWFVAAKTYTHFSDSESVEDSSLETMEEPDPEPYSPPVENPGEPNSSSFPY